MFDTNFYYCGKCVWGKSGKINNNEFNYEGMLDKNIHKPSGFGRSIYKIIPIFMMASIKMKKCLDISGTFYRVGIITTIILNKIVVWPKIGCNETVIDIYFKI